MDTRWPAGAPSPLIRDHSNLSGHKRCDSLPHLKQSYPIFHRSLNHESCHGFDLGYMRDGGSNALLDLLEYFRYFKVHKVLASLPLIGFHYSPHNGIYELSLPLITSGASSLAKIGGGGILTAARDGSNRALALLPFTPEISKQGLADLASHWHWYDRAPSMMKQRCRALPHVWWSCWNPARMSLIRYR